MTSLAAEIARQKGSRKPSEVKELILDKCSVAKLAGDEFEGFANLENLSMNGVGLTSLENFPSLQYLKRLELNDNKISGGLEVLQDLSLISLTVLTLSNNCIKSLDDLEPLGSLPNLKQLDLEHCEVASLEKYRETAFDVIPSLKVLDNLDRNGDEADLDDEDDDDDDGAESDVDVDDDGDEGDGEDDDDGEEVRRASAAVPLLFSTRLSLPSRPPGRHPSPLTVRLARSRAPWARDSLPGAAGRGRRRGGGRGRRGGGRGGR
jgi:acidic leucine-rich nuclear phosphoprotein 32 family protein A/C/D